MNTFSRSVKSLIVFSGLFLFAQLSYATTLNFTGNVTQTFGNLSPSDYLALGTAINGQLRYTDSGLTNASNFSFEARYTDYASSSGFTFNLPNGAISSKPVPPFAGINLSVVNNAGVYPVKPDTFGAYQDSFGINKGIHTQIYSLSVGFELSQPQSNLALPSSLETSDIVSGFWTIYFANGSGLAGTISTVNTVPLPSTFWLFGSSILGIITMRRCRK